MKKLSKLFIVSLIFSILGMNLASVSASELNFSVKAVIPENQRDTSKTYFDLNMNPGDQQTLTMELRNDTDKDVTVIPTIITATTNLNGVVEYGESNSTPDDTIPYLIEDLVKPTEEEVTIPAKGSYQLKLEVNMPEEEFDGILVGGIDLHEKEEEENGDNSEGQGLTIENNFAYQVAIVLQETDNEVPSELNLTNVEAGQVNARNVINATLQNTQPKFMNQLAVTAEITKKGSDKVLYTSEKEGMQMAPNTSFAYPISLNGKKLAAGEYTLNLTATSNGETWTFSEDFTITADEAKDLNSKDVTITPDYTWLYVGIGVAGVAVIVIIVIVVRKKLQEKERELEELRKVRDRVDKN